MVDREEDPLFARYFDGVRLAEKQVQEEKLDAAIRRGLEQGRTLRGKWQLRRWGAWTVGAAGALAVCLLLLFIGQNAGLSVGLLSPTTASQNEAIPSYVSSLMTSEMERAAEHGLYQPIGKSTEVEGTKVTVDGVLADGRTVVVFYSMENLLRKKIDSEVYLRLLDANGDTFDHLPVFLPSGTYPDDTVTHFKYALNIEDPDAPNRLLLSVSKEESNDKPIGEIPMEWSSRPYEGMEKIVPVKQTATVNRTKIAVREVILRPLSTMIVFEPQMRTDVQMAVNLKAKLYLGEKQKNQFHYYTRSRGAIYDQESLSNNEVTLQGIDFESLYYSDWNEVTLQIDGFGTLTKKERSFDLVIDTEKNQLLATDSAIQKVNVVPNQQSTLVRIYAEKKTKVDVGYPFQIKEEFNDHEGKKHRFLQEDGTPSYYLNGLTEIITFELEPKTYAQPLTFSLTEVVDSSYNPQQFKIPLK